ncbi:EamA family transporter [Asticcacaulis sp. 201]|uniref:EamA family transporter n=1 Tax=Asticcacaulis sp. 201 TaxID=3028787 RepID=UPI0039839A09
MKNLILTWPFWALLSAAFAALTAIFAKIGVEAVNPNLATFIRTAIIVVAAGIAVLATNSWQAPSAISGRSWLFLVLSGLATGASWFCYFRALKLGDASRVAPIDKLSVVFVAIFAVLFLGEKLSVPNWLGVAMIAGGAIMVAWRTA